MNMANSKKLLPTQLINFMNALEVATGVLIMCHALWPARSPDLSYCNFHLRGTLRDKAYVNKFHSLHLLKENNLQEISVIPRQQICNISRKTFSRCEAPSKVDPTVEVKRQRKLGLYPAVPEGHGNSVLMVNWTPLSINIDLSILEKKL
jgi:hypothetical protein